MPGLDPGIHRIFARCLSKMMDCRVKPGNDAWGIRATRDAQTRLEQRHTQLSSTAKADDPVFQRPDD
jgi:hypothetical protein